MKNPLLKARELENLVAVADSGTWGDEGTPADGSPVLRSTNITANRMDLQDPAWRIIPENDRERRRLHSGDIIVTKSSGSPDHIGKCAVFEHPNDDRDYYFSNFMLRLRAEPAILDYRWLYYWLTSNRGRSALQGLNSTTTGLRNLNVGQYLSQKIPLPYPDDPARSLAEQRRIADILDKADAIRRKRQESVEVFTSFLLSDFLDRFGDPGSNPKQWPSSTMGDALDLITYGLTVRPEYVSYGYRLVSAREIRSGCVDLEYAPFISSEDFESLSLKGKPEKGDILFSKTGSIGHCAEIRTDDVFALTQNVARLRFKPQVEPTFALYYLRSPFIQSLAQSRAKGNAVRDLQLGDMKTFPIYMPPMKEQRQFVRIAQKFEDAAKTTQLAQESVTSLFNCLVQRAFNGEL